MLSLYNKNLLTLKKNNRPLSACPTQLDGTEACFTLFHADMNVSQHFWDNSYFLFKKFNEKFNKSCGSLINIHKIH